MYQVLEVAIMFLWIERSFVFLLTSESLKCYNFLESTWTIKGCPNIRQGLIAKHETADEVDFMLGKLSREYYFSTDNYAAKLSKFKASPTIKLWQPYKTWVAILCAKAMTWEIINTEILCSRRTSNVAIFGNDTQHKRKRVDILF